jgi:hypothetical protein
MRNIAIYLAGAIPSSIRKAIKYELPTGDQPTPCNYVKMKYSYLQSDASESVYITGHGGKDWLIPIHQLVSEISRRSCMGRRRGQPSLAIGQNPRETKVGDPCVAVVIDQDIFLDSYKCDVLRVNEEDIIPVSSRRARGVGHVNVGMPILR